MKSEMLVNAIGKIDDDIIEGADKKIAPKKNVFIKYGALAAACFAVVFAVGFFAKTNPFKNNEFAFEKAYTYVLNDAEFSDYIDSKVVDEKDVGEKIRDTTVTAGWIYANDELKDVEVLSGEIYEIKGIPQNIAVCVKFTQKGDAVTTDHFYAMLNPLYIATPLVEQYVKPDFMGTIDYTGDIIPE
ncbi:MAG: hypothetical protein KBS59_08205 [Clostridiales bacterium]|nr:hypothetical protein [Clostridiales bacterium]